MWEGQRSLRTPTRAKGSGTLSWPPWVLSTGTHEMNLALNGGNPDAFPKCFVHNSMSPTMSGRQKASLHQATVEKW